MDIQAPAQIDAHEIRSRFEDALKSSIHQLTDTMPEAVSLPFDIVTITSLILMVERENEIQAFSESSPGRYSKETLKHDLIDTGLDMDDTLTVSMDNLIEMGFVSTNGDGVLVPRESTPKLVAVLDNLYPGMPGINLVAYFIQTMDEVITGRKELDHAIRQFEQTLQNRGNPLSKTHQTPVTGDNAAASLRISTSTAQPHQAGAQRRDTYMQRLREMRAKQPGYSAGGAVAKTLVSQQRIEVKSLFPAPSPSPTLLDEPVGDDSESTSMSEAEPPDTLEISDPQPIAEMAPDAHPDACRTDSLPPEDTDYEIGQKNQDTPDLATENGAPDTPIVSVEPADDPMISGDGPEDDLMSIPVDATVDSDPSRVDGVPSDADPISGKETVEEKVQAFQDSLAMTCPYCRQGKIQTAETEKGKIFYSCDNAACNFISWGKPYHFDCPYCQNPFLVEFTTHDGINGLKCPKATCNYRQDHLQSPHISTESPPSHAAAESVDPPKKKRKKLVRKRLVRRKR